MTKSQKISAAASNAVEALEERRMFAAMGTMNVADGGTSPFVLESYTLNGVKDVGEAGVYNFTRSATNPGTYAGRPAAGQTFGAFCLDPNQDFPSGANIGYTVVDLASANDGTLGAAKADQISELWGRFRSTIGTDATKAAAFQMAVWEIVTDAGKNLSAGAFVADSSTAATAAVKTQAQAWLDALDGTGAKANLAAMASPTDQDEVFEVPATQPPCNPPPPCNPKPCMTLTHGETATIGFWQNKNGQALLKGLNGGATATKLGNWLAANFANLWGKNAGQNNLAGKTNAQVAAFFVTKFNVKGVKLDAQMLGAAFACYVTNASLAGNVAAHYGFKVTALGTGAATINVGLGGAAFGVKNNTTITVMDALKAADRLSAGGKGTTQFDAFNGNAALRSLANVVFGYINEHGDI